MTELMQRTERQFFRIANFNYFIENMVYIGIMYQQSFFRIYTLLHTINITCSSCFQ